MILTDNILRCMTPEARKSLGKAGLTAAEAQAKMECKAERELHNQVANLLRLRGITAGHAAMHKKSTFTKGWPDFTFAYKGKPVAWELKVGDGKLSFWQEWCRDGLIMDGWDYRVIRSLEEAKSFL